MQSCRRRLSDRKWKEAAKRPVRIYKAAAMALLRALLKGDKAVGGTCVWWESKNPADSLVSPSDALLGTPALFVKLSVKREVFTGTWVSRAVAGTQVRLWFSLFYWFIWIFSLHGGGGRHSCCRKRCVMFHTVKCNSNRASSTDCTSDVRTYFMCALELRHDLRFFYI